MTELPFACPILVMAPHPDDESLGCGALLSACWAAGHAAHVVCLTDGGASHPGSRLYPPERLAALRRGELCEAIRHLGGDPERDLTWLGFPDAALHRIAAPGQDLAAALERLVTGLGIRTLLAPSPHDPHCDHVVAAEAALQLEARHPGLVLAFYPVWARWVAERHDPPRARALRVVYGGGRAGSKARAIAAHRSQFGQVVPDSPQGFVIPEGFAGLFAGSPELYDRATS